MATLDPEPFGKPTLLLESSLPLDLNDTAAFISSELLNTRAFSGSGDGGKEGDAFYASSPPCAARLDVAEYDKPLEFKSNGLLDGSTQMRSTVNFF